MAIEEPTETVEKIINSKTMEISIIIIRVIKTNNPTLKITNKVNSKEMAEDTINTETPTMAPKEKATIITDNNIKATKIDKRVDTKKWDLLTVKINQ